MLADGVIPNEYGINPKQKLKIGSKIARRLLGKILIDLHNTRQEVTAAAAESNAYNDDSHKETKYCLDPKYANVVEPERRVRTRLYFTSVPLEHPKRFRIEMTFSRGADISTLEVIFIPFKCLEDRKIFLQLLLVNLYQSASARIHYKEEDW
nr:unnamed protein product [Digitaria exilis]